MRPLRTLYHGQYTASHPLLQGVCTNVEAAHPPSQEGSCSQSRQNRGVPRPSKDQLVAYEQEERRGVHLGEGPPEPPVPLHMHRAPCWFFLALTLLHWEPLQDKAAHVSSLSLDARKELGSVSIGGVGLVLEGRDVGAEGIDSGVTLTGAGILALPLTHCVTPRRLPNTSEPSPEKVGD